MGVAIAVVVGGVVAVAAVAVAVLVAIVAVIAAAAAAATAAVVADGVGAGWADAIRVDAPVRGSIGVVTGGGHVEALLLVLTENVEHSVTNKTPSTTRRNTYLGRESSTHAMLRLSTTPYGRQVHHFFSDTPILTLFGCSEIEHFGTAIPTTGTKHSDLD